MFGDCCDNVIPSNLFANASFDVLSMDGLDAPILDIKTMSQVNMEENYFVSALYFLKDINEQVTNAKILLYKNINEAANASVMLESFSDYYVQVEAVVSKFLKFLKAKLDEFIASMENFIKENDMITKHKSELKDMKEYTGDDSIDGYNFTIDESIPNISALEKFNVSLFDDMLAPNVTDLSVDSVKNAIKDTDIEKNYATFRARLLGKDDEVTESEFDKYLHMIYRDNAGNSIPLQIDKLVIRSVAEKWFSFSEIKAALNKDYKTIENSYNELLDKISKTCKNNNGLTIGAFTNMLPGDAGLKTIDGKAIDNAGAMMSSDMMLTVDIYCKAKVDQMQKYTDVTLMAVTAKLDAIKAMYQQYRSILLKACYTLEQSGGEEK